MRPGKTIRARVELTCSLALRGSDLKIVRGITEEITRESLVVNVPSNLGSSWLQPAASVLIAIDLPVNGMFEPRVLQCTATVSEISLFRSRTRIVAGVQRIAFVNRQRVIRNNIQPVSRISTVRSLSPDHLRECAGPLASLNNFNSKTRETNMTFLKSLFNEEDGQDMVEYGLIIALVVVGLAAAYGAYQGKLLLAFTALGTKIGTVIQ
jgi:Flp pilus assembly pilin Flp